jgi:hypothetical protein
VTGSLRTFYANGAAVFSGLTLSGAESASYELTFTLDGLDLFGNDIDAHSRAASVRVQQCEPGESFDSERLVCICAVGFGLVVETNTCRNCTDNEVVPPGSLSCEQCPLLSRPISLNNCECNVVRTHALHLGRAYTQRVACTP